MLQGVIIIKCWWVLYFLRTVCGGAQFEGLICSCTFLLITVNGLFWEVFFFLFFFYVCVFLGYCTIFWILLIIFMNFINVFFFFFHVNCITYVKRLSCLYWFSLSHELAPHLLLFFTYSEVVHSTLKGAASLGIIHKQSLAPSLFTLCTVISLNVLH